MEIITKSIKETHTVANTFSKIMGKNKGKIATTVALNGDLGAGKTAFTKEFATIIGIKDTLVSPTFILERIYKIPEKSILGKSFKSFIHIDAYRLSSGKDLVELGWEELISNPKNLIFIEWPKRIRDVLPEKTKNIYFEFIDENTRKISW